MYGIGKADYVRKKYYNTKYQKKISWKRSWVSSIFLMAAWFSLTLTSFLSQQGDSPGINDGFSEVQKKYTQRRNTSVHTARRGTEHSQ